MSSPSAADAPSRPGASGHTGGKAPVAAGASNAQVAPGAPIEPVAGVVFDLDGTLYPFGRAILLSASVVLRHQRFFRAFGRTRHELRDVPLDAVPAADQSADADGDAHGDADSRAALRAARLRELQSTRLAERLGIDADRASGELRRIVHGEWARIFGRVKPYAGVLQTLAGLRQRGARLGVLSDSPLVEEKLLSLGVAEFWDVAIAADEAGGFKPHPWPFTYVAHRLGIPPERLLYVGNHYRYDIVGARRAGMLAAHFARRPVAFGAAHYTFSNYSSFPEIEIVPG